MFRKLLLIGLIILLVGVGMAVSWGGTWRAAVAGTYVNRDSGLDLQLNEDGTFSMDTGFGDTQGNWKVKGTEVIFTNLSYGGQQFAGWQTGQIKGNTISTSGVDVWVKQ